MAQTILLDFTVGVKHVATPDLQDFVSKKVENGLNELFPNIRKLCNYRPEDGLYIVYSNDDIVLVTLRVYKSGLVTLAIEYPKGESDVPVVTFDVSIA